MEVYTILKREVRVPLLANSPHSSTFIPSGLRRSFLLNDDEMNRELLLLTDRYVDELFSSIPEAGGILVKYNLSRLVVDPERFENDEKEEMSKVGMGAIYLKASDGRSLRNKPDQTERERLLGKFYRPYHRAMEQEAQSLLEKFGRCLILDCHSFSSVPLPFEPDQDPERPDICVGTDKFHTPGPLMQAVEQFFNKIHLVVTLNKPYTGTYIPSKYLGKKDIWVSSIMIEVNRRLYMDEKTGKKLSRFEDVKNAISVLIHSVVVPHVTTKG